MRKVIVISFITLLISYALFTGCQSPPTAFERKFYDIETNYVPIVRVMTNIVTITNYHTIVTNVVVGTNVIVITNLVPVISTTSNLVPVTNLAELYGYKPNTNAAAVVDTVRSIGGYFGFGDLAAILTGGAVSLWGLLRSRKFKMTAEALSQIIETGSEILKSTPQGQPLDAQWKAWMVKHQAETGTIQSVLKILNSSTDNQEAKSVAEQLIKILQTK